MATTICSSPLRPSTSSSRSTLFALLSFVVTVFDFFSCFVPNKIYWLSSQKQYFSLSVSRRLHPVLPQPQPELPHHVQYLLQLVLFEKLYFLKNICCMKYKWLSSSSARHLILQYNRHSFKKLMLQWVLITRLASI